MASSLANIYSQLTDADLQKEAHVAEQNGDMVYDEDTMEKAAHYDQIGRNLAHQIFAQQMADPELAKEAMDGMPPAFAAAAAAKAKGSDKDEDEDEDEDKKKSKSSDEDEDKKKYKDRMAAMEEKKASIMQAMASDDDYLGYILDKYVVAEEE